MRFQHVGFMVSQFFYSRYALCICGVFSVALMFPSIAVSAVTPQCPPFGSTYTFTAADAQEAWSECRASYDLRVNTDCQGVATCSENKEEQKVSMAVKNVIYGYWSPHIWSYAVPECAEGFVLDPITRECVEDCSLKEGESTGGWLHLDSGAQYTTDGTCNGLLSPVTNGEVSCDTYSGIETCYIEAIFTYDGTNTDLTPDDPVLTIPPDGVEPVSEVPVYSESFNLVSSDSETLPDGTVVDTTVEQYSKEKSGTVSYEQGANGEIIKVTPDGESVVMTVTTTKTTNPDGSTITEITESTAYEQPDSLVAHISTTTDENNVTYVTNITTTTAPGTSVESQTTTTETTDADGNVTSSTSTTSGDPDGVDGAEDAVSSSGTIEGGELETPDTAIGDSAKEYGESTKGHMDRIKASPIVSAATSAFNVTVPSGSCPSLTLDLSPLMGTVGTTVHCDLMDYINSTLYPLLLAMWGLAGVMIFLRA